MKRGALLLLLMLFLSACKQEPMITISPEVQSSIDKKISERQGQTVESSVSSAEGISSVASGMDITSWTKAEANTIYDIAQYVPNNINQLKQMYDGQSIQLWYTDFVDQAQQLYQVRTLLPDGRQNVDVYQLTQVGWQRNFQVLNTYNSLNQLTNVGNQPDVILASPVQQGTQWQDAQGNQWTITALYSSGVIQESTFEDIVEVTSIQNRQAFRYYYAKNMGLILSQVEPIESSQQASTQLVIQQNQPSVSITQSIQLYAPTNNNQAILEAATGALTWQTTQPIGQTWTALLRQQNWINNQVEVKNITLKDGIITVDFTPGVVAAMNQHPLTEKKVIPAIVSTIGNYYGVKQVKLTVSQAILLPDILKLPTGGIWEVQSGLQNDANSQ